MAFSFKKALGWKIIVLLNLALLFFFSFNFIKEWNRNRQLALEIKKLEAAAQEVEAKNLDVLNLAKFLDSREFLENEARIKLGMKNPGEEAIVVAMPEAGAITTDAKPVDLKNYQRWWLHFFGKR